MEMNKIFQGDCIEVLQTLPDNSIDLVVTDPPYGLSFMGKDWDKTLPPREAFEEIIRVVKPGALAFVMSSPRQDVLWRMLSMLEGVGFELTQSYIDWIYKTGFPKAYDVSKGIDKKLGNEREVVGIKIRGDVEEAKKKGVTFAKAVANRNNKAIFGYGIEKITRPASELAKKWDGWKSQTGLKPAHEPILMVNKPFSESTIVDNVLKWGTGAINVDVCRIPFKQNESPEEFAKNFDDSRRTAPKFSGKYNQGKRGEYRNRKPQIFNGRFPANLLVSDKAIDTGKITQTDTPNRFPKTTGDRDGSVSGDFGIKSGIGSKKIYSDSGDQSRYFDLDAWAEHHGFLDVPKPDNKERSFGIKGKNIHPTVKPVKLMAYLIELGCPPDGVVLDPFMGSGTTCIAAKKLVRKYIGIEINPEYFEIAKARIAAYPNPLSWFE